MSENFSRRKALTWIICTVVVVLGLPAGAFAVVAGSNAFITDPSSGHRAHVNTSGQLSVNVGNLPATQRVSGTVTALGGTPYSTSCAVAQVGVSVGGGCTFAIPAGRTFEVRTVSARATVGASDHVTLGTITLAGSGVSSYFFPMTATYASSSGALFVASESVDFVLVPGATVLVENSAVDDTLQGRVFLSGYLH